MKETELYNWYQPCIAKAGTIYRIENSVGNGFPDVMCCINGVVSFLENKIRKGDYLYFEKFQLPWHRTYMISGGRVFVVAATELKNSDFMVELYDSRSLVGLRREPYKDMVRVNVGELLPIFCLLSGDAKMMLLRKLSQP